MTTTIYGVVPPQELKDLSTNKNTAAPIFGVKFPLFDSTNAAKGIFNKTRGFELMKSMVRQFVKTERGERVMLPNFGLSLKRFLFEPITPDLILSIENEIYTGFARYLPSVRIIELRVLSGDTIQGFGLPGIKIVLTISPVNSFERTELSLNL